MLSARIHGLGVLGPGFADWPAAAAVLRGDAPYVRAPTVLPQPLVLPAAERRRAGRVVKLALAIGAEALASAHIDARELPSVFSSSGGDGDNCHEICQTLAGNERLISPTRFHNSVHNAAAGYWCIAYGSTAASTALCAYDASFGAGLLEALVQLARGASAILLVSYDLDYPPPLRWHRPIADAFGIALLLEHSDAAPPPLSRVRARLQVSFTEAVPSAMDNPELEELRRQVPAARALPLLERLARERSGAAVLDYMDATRLVVEIET